MEKLERKFGEIRKYLDVISNISICMAGTLSYENYRCSVEVPHTYDDFYVYGIGLINEFFEDRFNPGQNSYQPGIEVMLSETPREYQERA